MNLCVFALLFLGLAVTVAVDAQTEFASDLSKRGRVVEGCDGGLSCGDFGTCAAPNLSAYRGNLFVRYLQKYFRKYSSYFQHHILEDFV